MLEELAPKWQARRESALRERRGGERRRAAGAGRRQRLVFTDRLLVTLVHLRLGLPHAALAELYRVDRSTVSGAIRELRPLLVARDFALPGRPGLRLHTLEDLFAYTAAEASGCGSTARRCRSGARARAAPAGRRSCPARRGRTPSRPPPSVTARAAPADPDVIARPCLYFNAARLDRSLAISGADYARLAVPHVAASPKPLDIHRSRPFTCGDAPQA
ncbi:transposase family protein [Streptomyces sp. NPDC048484]|uniref:transposase family protein n=1 Tax=Streptomyces sp. NPDC048484 TaxID=3155146 RepID=UPI003416ABCF